jgi:hypothetical protein
VLTAVVVTDGSASSPAVGQPGALPAPDEDEIRHYVASGEAADKAGAYGIQGRAALFIEEIRGSYTGIMGLPLFETAPCCRNSAILCDRPPAPAGTPDEETNPQPGRHDAPSDSARARRRTSGDRRWPGPAGAITHHHLHPPSCPTNT